MKTTKRFLAAVLALTAITVTTPMSAFATDYTAEGNASTDVTYTSNAAYTVTIPATVALGETATISAENVVLNAGEQLNVTLSGTSETDNAFKLTTATDSLTYTVSKGEDSVSVGDVVLNVAAGTTSGSSDLKFNEPATTPNAGDYTGTVTFTISVKSAKTDVSSVAIDDKSTTALTKGETLNLSATVDADATDKTITWKSSDATIASVDSTGKVTANKTGSAIITVTATNGTEDTADDKTDTITITVTNPANGITLNKTALALTKGGTETLTATVDPTDADGTVSWSSDDVTVATVDSNGKVTAVAPGTATITATIGSKSATCTVSVNSETLTLSHTTGTDYSLTASSTNGSGWRMYGGSTINISSTNGKTIKKVELTIAGYGNSRNLNNFAVSSGTKTANGTTAGCIVTISDVNATTLTLTDNNSNAAKQYIFNKAVIYFE